MAGGHYTCKTEREVGDCAHVEVDEQVHLLGRQLGHQLEGKNAGIVDKHLHSELVVAAELLNVGSGRWGCKVGKEGETAHRWVFCLDCGLGGSELLALVAHQQQIVSAAGKLAGKFGTYSRGAAGYYGNIIEHCRGL